MNRHALLLVLLLAASSAHAQDPVAPPDPVTPPETQPLPSPAPTPAPPPVPTPAPAPLPTKPRAIPLSIVFQETIATAVNGAKVYEPFVRTLDLGQERSDVLRAGGKLTTSLRADVERFARSFDRAPQNARFEYAPLLGQWHLTYRNGIKVDVEATLAAVEAALAAPAMGRVNVVYSKSAPERTLDTFLKRGISGMIGEGTTNYAGSSRARTTNIHVGAARFRDVLVTAPVISFNEIVGPVESANGFVPGLVISGERTATGVGGGICQVSTTLFRTLFSAGLPIVERKNHSYQVHYYDPQGLDATIYQPTLDLKFRNDTGAPVWFQTEWDDRLGNLIIRAFGKPRAETVEIAQPRVLARQAPPAPRYITDPTLAPGRRVQIDWAAQGATIEVDRIFRKDGRIVRKDTVRSVYRPWPNIFLVGPAAKTSASSSAKPGASAVGRP